MKTIKEAVGQRLAEIEEKKQAGMLDEGVMKFSEAMVKRLEADYGVAVDPNDEEYKWEVKRLQASEYFDLHILSTRTGGTVWTAEPLTLEMLADATHPIVWLAAFDFDDEQHYTTTDLIAAIAYALTGERL